MYKYFNPNPKRNRTGDCVIRALAKATGKSWDDIFIELCVDGYSAGDMPTANYIWGRYLIKHGFSRSAVPDDCPDCYTVEDFAEQHPHGTFVLGTGSHAVTVKDGVIYDSWDSSGEQPVYFYHKQ